MAPEFKKATLTWLVTTQLLLLGQSAHPASLYVLDQGYISDPPASSMRDR